MKKMVLISGIFIVLGVLAMFISFNTSGALAQGGPGYGQPGWNCPYGGAWQGGNGNYMMDRRGMHRGGDRYDRGPGMHRGWQGYGQQPGYQSDPQYKRSPLEKEEAKDMIHSQLRWSRNPNLKVGEIKDEGDFFEADVVTKDNSLVDKLRIDKDSGFIRSVY
jgi:hypothetical protein